MRVLLTGGTFVHWSQTQRDGGRKRNEIRNGYRHTIYDYLLLSESGRHECTIMISAVFERWVLLTIEYLLGPAIRVFIYDVFGCFSVLMRPGLPQCSERIDLLVVIA